MESRDYIIILYDYYSELFNEKQREYFEEYYFNNLSLSEIAESLNVSRNAVHKALQSVEEKLNFFEEKLGLYRKNKNARSCPGTVRYYRDRSHVPSTIQSS